MNERILLIDDDGATREVISLALADEGYEVRSVPHGKAALGLVESFRPHLIILDMRMPVMDGWSFVEQYRARTGPHAPILVCTAAPDTRRRAIEVRADAHLERPFVLADLFAVVRETIRGGGSRPPVESPQL